MPAIKIYDKLTSLRYIFLYQVWLFTRPKFSRKFIQRADVLHTVCFLAYLLETCAKCVEGHFFLVYSTCMNFFHLNFPLHDIFFVLRPALPPTPLTFIMARPLRLQRARPFAARCRKDVFEWLLVPRWNFAIISIVTQKKQKTKKKGRHRQCVHYSSSFNESARIHGKG